MNLFLDMESFWRSSDWEKYLAESFDGVEIHGAHGYLLTVGLVPRLCLETSRVVALVPRLCLGIE